MYTPFVTLPALPAMSPEICEPKRPVSAEPSPFGARKTEPASPVYTPFVTVPALPVTEPVMVELNVLAPVKVFDVYVLGMVVEAWMRAMMPEEKFETWELVMERLARVVIEATEVVAARSVMKRLSASVLEKYLLVEPSVKASVEVA